MIDYDSMTDAEKQVILAVGQTAWEAILPILARTEKDCQKALAQFSNTRDQDCFYKGGLVMVQSIMEIRENIIKINAEAQKK